MLSVFNSRLQGSEISSWRGKVSRECKEPVILHKQHHHDPRFQHRDWWVIRSVEFDEAILESLSIGKAKQQSALPVNKDTILIVVERHIAIDRLQSVQGLLGEVVTDTTSPSKSSGQV